MSTVSNTCNQSTLGIDASRANAARRTGVEWYAYNVIQELKEVVPPSVRVLLYSAEPLRDDLATLPPNWESRVLRWPPRRLWTLLRLSWEMWRRPPDLLFVPAHVLPPLLPRRSAITLHDVGFAVVPSAYGRLERWWQSLAVWVAGRRADIVLTVSEFSKKEIVRHFAVADEKITVTPLAVRSERYSAVGPDDEAVRHRYRLHGPYFLFVGRLEKKKNVRGLLRGFADFRQTTGFGHSLVLVGPNADAHPQFADGGSVAGVLPLGYVCPDDLPAIYRGATALIMPSWYEGFGLPVLEAFAAGTPVIISQAGSLPEVAGDAALSFAAERPAELAECLRRLAREAALRDDLIRQGRERLANFSWCRTAELTWAALRSRLGPHCDK